MQTIPLPRLKGLDARTLAARLSRSEPSQIGPIIYSAKALSAAVLEVHTDRDRRVIDTREGTAYCFPLPKHYGVDYYRAGQDASVKAAELLDRHAAH